MKSKFYLFILIISILCLASSCKKKPTYYMPQEFKDYVDFPVGSYWIYEDSVSGIKDSIYLYGRNLTIYECEYNYCNYEKLEQNFYCLYWQQCSGISMVEEIDPLIYTYIGPLGYYFGDCNVGTNVYNGEYLAYYDSLNINNKWYKEVKCFCRNNIGWNNDLIYYWAKDIGVIRKEEPTSPSSDTILVWNLKSYHINN